MELLGYIVIDIYGCCIKLYCMLLYLDPILSSPQSLHGHFAHHALVKFDFVAPPILTAVAWNTLLTSSEDSPRRITSISSSIKIFYIFFVEPAYAVKSSYYHHRCCKISA